VLLVVGDASSENRLVYLTTVCLNFLAIALYLSLVELYARLHASKSVEQWLGYAKDGDETVLHWLCIAAGRRQYSVTYLESFDEGDADWLDVAAFSLVDPDAEIGPTFDSVEEAVAFAVNTHSASLERFVAGGMIQQEYANYRQSK
jgi:hypothetical protein